MQTRLLKAYTECTQGILNYKITSVDKTPLQAPEQGLGKIWYHSLYYTLDLTISCKFEEILEAESSENAAINGWISAVLQAIG